MLEGVLLNELGVEVVDTPTGKNAGVRASVIFTPGGVTAGTDDASKVADTEEASAPAPTPEGAAADAAEITAVVDEVMGGLGAPLERLYALFGLDQADLQVMPAVTLSNVGTTAVRAAE